MNAITLSGDTAYSSGIFSGGHSDNRNFQRLRLHTQLKALRKTEEELLTKKENLRLEIEGNAAGSPGIEQQWKKANELRERAWNAKESAKNAW